MKRIITVYVLLSFLPIGIIGCGIYWAAKKSAVYEKYIKAEGDVIELDKKGKDMSDGVGSVAYYPRIRYYDSRNQEHVFESKIGSNPPRLRVGESVGEKVDLLVNPKNPEDVVIDSFFHKWFGPTVVFIIGFITLILVIAASVRVISSECKRDRWELSK